MSQINKVMMEAQNSEDNTNSDLPIESINSNLDKIPDGNKQDVDVSNSPKLINTNQKGQTLDTDEEVLGNTIADASNISNQQNQEYDKNNHLNNSLPNQQDQTEHNEEMQNNNSKDDNKDNDNNNNENEKVDGDEKEDKKEDEEEEEDDDDDDGEINIKDFAYSVSDPKHFGIYNDIDDDDKDEEGREQYEEEEYDNGYGYSNYGQYNGNEMYDDIQQEEHVFINNENMIDGRNYSDINETNNSNSYSNEESDDILHAVALYEFMPENSNELPLVPDQLLIINYECGDGWLVAHDPATGQTGLVPSEYIRILEIDTYEEEYEGTEDPDLYNEFAEDVKEAQRFMPEILSVDNNTEYNNNEHNDNELTQNIEKISLT